MIILLCIRIARIFIGSGRKHVKVIRENDAFWQTHLTPIRLAYWISGDGYRKTSQKMQYNSLHKWTVGMRFSTESFTFDERHYLGSMFQQKYGIGYTVGSAGSEQHTGWAPGGRKHMPLLSLGQDYVDTLLLTPSKMV